MPQVDPNTIPAEFQLTAAEAAEFEGVTREAMYKRTRAGENKEVTWALAANDGPGPKQRRVIDARSLTVGVPGTIGPREKALREVGRRRMEVSKFFGSQETGGRRQKKGADERASFHLEAGPAVTTMNPTKAQREMFGSELAQKL